jgi:hypothetical protein
MTVLSLFESKGHGGCLKSWDIQPFWFWMADCRNGQSRVILWKNRKKRDYALGILNQKFKPELFKTKEQILENMNQKRCCRRAIRRSFSEKPRA